MRARLHPFQLAAALLLVCGGILAGVYWMRRGSEMGPATLVALLPERPGTLIYLDFASARQSGLLHLLDGSPSGEDADYRQFVAQTRVNYQRDLDAAAILFTGGEEFFLLRGRFDWKSLETYAAQHGGACEGGVCRMSGSRPERKISFSRLRDEVMSMAVSPDADAVRQIHAHSARGDETTSGAVWVKTSAKALEASGLFPEPAKLLLASVDAARPIIFTLSVQGGRLVARAQLDCPDPSAATQLEAQLEGGTAALRAAVQREHPPADSVSLAGVLAGGVFHCERSRVIGEWPLPSAWFAALGEGGTN